MRFISQDKRTIYDVADFAIETKRTEDNEYYKLVLVSDSASKNILDVNGGVLGEYRFANNALTVIDEISRASDFYAIPLESEVNPNPVRPLTTLQVVDYFVALYGLIGDRVACNQLKLKKAVVAAYVIYYASFHKELMSDIKVQYFHETGFGFDSSEVYIKSPITKNQFNDTQGRIYDTQLLNILQNSETKPEMMPFKDMNPITKSFLLDVFIEWGGRSAKNIECNLFGPLSKNENFPIIQGSGVTFSRAEIHELIDSTKLKI